MKIPPGSLKLLQAQRDHLETAHAAAAQRVEAARTALTRAHEDRLKPQDPDESGPTAAYRAASAEADIRIGTRRIAEAAANIEAHKRTMKTAEEAAVELAAFEKALTATSALDSAMTDTSVTFVAQLRDRTDQLCELHRFAVEAWSRLPNSVREAIPMPTARWLPAAGDANLPRLLRVAGSAS